MNNYEKNANRFGNALKELFKKKTFVDKAKDSVTGVANKVKDTVNEGTKATTSFYKKNKNIINPIGAGAAGLGVGAAGMKMYSNRNRKNEKKASFYAIGKELLEKDAFGPPQGFGKYIMEKLRNGGDKITSQGAKNLVGSTWRKGKSQVNKGKSWIREKSINALGKEKGLERWNKTVGGARKALPYAVGTGLGVGGALAYNKYNRKHKKEAMSMPGGVTRLVNNVKDKVNLFKSVKGGKNNLYNTYSELGADHAKGVVSAARKKLGKQVAGVGGAATAIGGTGYMLGKNKEASYYDIGRELLEKDANIFGDAGRYIKGKSIAAKDYVKSKSIAAKNYAVEKNPYKGVFRSKKSGKNKAYEQARQVLGDGIAGEALKATRKNTGLLFGGGTAVGLGGGYALGRRKKNKD